jgi:hypothetical protein
VNRRQKKKKKKKKKKKNEYIRSSADPKKKAHTPGLYRTKTLAKQTIVNALICFVFFVCLFFLQPRDAVTAGAGSDARGAIERCGRARARDRQQRGRRCRRLGRIRRRAPAAAGDNDAVLGREYPQAHRGEVLGRDEGRRTRRARVRYRYTFFFFFFFFFFFPYTPTHTHRGLN